MILCCIAERSGTWKKTHLPTKNIRMEGCEEVDLLIVGAGT